MEFLADVPAIVCLVAGLALLVAGGEGLVRGAAALAQKACPAADHRLDRGQPGHLRPELFASVQAATQGSPGLAIGNVLGSNVANLALILGLTALCALCWWTAWPAPGHPAHAGHQPALWPGGLRPEISHPRASLARPDGLFLGHPTGALGTEKTAGMEMFRRQANDRNLPVARRCPADGDWRAISIRGLCGRGGGSPSTLG